MAIKLIANYSKKLGLPGYSSHQFSVSVETELNTTDDIAAESERLYQLLQSNVDGQMQNPGFVPSESYATASDNPSAHDNPVGFIRDPSVPNNARATNVTTVANWQRGPAWKCSDKQKDLILKLVEEHQLDKADVEALAVERFGKGVRQLSKLEASGLIDELLDNYGGGWSNTSQGNAHRRNGSAYRGGANGRRDAA
jgi:hypothetical protein